MIDADFRVVGEGRWAPFRRWLAPKLVALAQLFIVWAVGTAILLATRHWS